MAKKAKGPKCSALQINGNWEGLNKKEDFLFCEFYTFPFAFEVCVDTQIPCLLLRKRSLSLFFVWVKRDFFYMCGMICRLYGLRNFIYASGKCPQSKVMRSDCFFSGEWTKRKGDVRLAWWVSPRSLLSILHSFISTSLWKITYSTVSRELNFLWNSLWSTVLRRIMNECCKRKGCTLESKSQFSVKRKERHDKGAQATKARY